MTEPEKTNFQLFEEAFNHMNEVLLRFQTINHSVRTREMSLAITNLEQAGMWANKDAKERNV